MIGRHPTGALEGVPPDELEAYLVLWDRLRTAAQNEAKEQEIDAIFARCVA